MVDQVQLQEDTERLRKTEFIIPTGPRDRRHIMHGHMGKTPGWSGGRRWEQVKHLGFSIISK